MWNLRSTEISYTCRKSEKRQKRRQGYLGACALLFRATEAPRHVRVTDAANEHRRRLTKYSQYVTVREYIWHVESLTLCKPARFVRPGELSDIERILRLIRYLYVLQRLSGNGRQQLLLWNCRGLTKVLHARIVRV